MTVENTQNKMPPLQMGTATEYPFTFAVLLQDPTEEEALEAIKASVLLADGTEIELEYGTDYTVTLNTDRIGGTLTVNNIRTASDYLTIYRQYEQTQEVDYKDFNSAPAETFEQCFDKLTMLSQQQQEEINRSLKLNVSSTIVNPSLPEPIANNTLIWDSEGTGLDNYDIIGENNQFKAEVNSALAAGQADIQAQFDTLEAQVNTDLTDGLQNIQTQLDDFEEEINTDIAEVREAADKINQLEESVATATTAATSAQNSATNALNSANAASQLVQDAEETLQTRANLDLSNLSATGQAKFDAKANLDLSNLSETGEKHFLNKSQITNCLLEVPQKIKLELNDGVLTLKAGSKVIVPNGFEEDGTTPRFDEVVIESDLSASASAYEDCDIFFNPAGNTIARYATDTNISGTTIPAENANFYNTSTNKIYRYNVGVLGEQLSFPIARVSYDSNGVISAIDQVFNGMGYIGSTLWVDKDVKGLIPNGRNADGSLKNREYITKNIHIKTEGGTRNTNYIAVSVNTANLGTTAKAPYVTDDNYLYWAGVKRTDRMIIATCTVTNDVISNFQPKLPFRAVDYKDALLKTDKTEIMTWNLPDWANTITISSATYTCPSLGWVKIYVNSVQHVTANFTINDIPFTLSASSGNYVDSGNVLLPVAKGDVISCNGTNKLYYFIPMKGVD